MSTPNARTMPMPWPYQSEGATWIYDMLTANNRAVLLADDAGLGKTRQVIQAAQLGGWEKLLVMGPACARHVWRNEIFKWAPEWRDRVLVLHPGVSMETVKRHLQREQRILIVAFDTVSHAGTNWRGMLSRHPGDLLVIDEAHYLKNPSLRTEAIYGRSGSASGIQAAYERVVLLSGTITPNHAGELYQHCRTFWPEAITDMRPGGDRVVSVAEFEEKYTKFKTTPWGRQIVGSQNQDVLRKRLGHWVKRRRKHEVLPQLPPLVAQDVALDVRPWEIHDLFNDTMLHAAEPLQAVVDRAYLTRDEELLEVMRRESVSLVTLRRALGELKVDATVQWVIERLQCGVNKILLFGWHIHVLNRLHRLLAEFDPVIVTGQSTQAMREQAETLFQTRSTVRVFVGQILAAGHAITLTAANEVAIVEPSWVPSQNAQAIARAHRMGQHDSVLASFLYVPGTIDEHVMRVFRRKAAEVALLQGDNLNDNGNGTETARNDRNRHSGPGGPVSAGADIDHAEGDLAG